MIDFGDMENFENRIKFFCEKYNHLYLYGAGLYGKIFFEYLKLYNIDIDCFITTNEEGKLFDKPIIRYSDIREKLDDKCGIILSVNGDLQEDIINDNEFLCAIFVPDPLAFIYMDARTFLKEEYFDSSMCQMAEEYNGETIDNILVVQIEVTFGDMIWSSAFLRELKRSFPNSHITMVINPVFASLFRNCPYIDELLVYGADNLNSVISIDMVERCKKYVNDNLMKGFDAIFLPRLLPMTCSDAWENVLLAVYSDARYRFGHIFYISEEDKFRYKLVHKLFSDIAKHKQPHHEAFNDLELLKLVSQSPQNEVMELWINDADEEYANRVLDINKFIIVVGVVGSKKNRSWSPEKYAMVFNKLLAKYNDIQIVLLGGMDAVDSANIIQEITTNSCLNMTGKTTLMQTAAIISDAQLYVGSDTGLMHMASASGISVIEISASNKTSPGYWGSSSVRTGPWKVNSIILQPEHGLDDCKYMCHKSYAHCINQICADEVFDAIVRFKESNKP